MNETDYIPTDAQLEAMASDPNAGVIDAADVAKGDDRPIFVGPAIVHLAKALWIKQDNNPAVKMLFQWESDSDLTDMNGVAYPPGTMIRDFLVIKANPTRKDGSAANVAMIEDIGFRTIERSYMAAYGKFGDFKTEFAAKLKAALQREGESAANKQDVADPYVKFILGKPVKQVFKVRYQKVNGVEDRTMPAYQGFSPRAVKKA